MAHLEQRQRRCIIEQRLALQDDRQHLRRTACNGEGMCRERTSTQANAQVRPCDVLMRAPAEHQLPWATLAASNTTTNEANPSCAKSCVCQA